MFRKMSLKYLYETYDDVTIGQRIVHSVVVRVCPVIAFVLAIAAFKHMGVVPEQREIVFWR